MVIIIRAIIALNIQRAAEPVVMRGISPVLPARSLPITSYQRAGGFSPMVAHEDVTLARALESIGARSPGQHATACIPVLEDWRGRRRGSVNT